MRRVLTSVTSSSWRSPRGDPGPPLTLTSSSATGETEDSGTIKVVEEVGPTAPSRSSTPGRGPEMSPDRSRKRRSGGSAPCRNRAARLTNATATHRSRRGGARRRLVANRSVTAPRPHAPQHDGQLRRHRPTWRPHRRADRSRNVADTARQATGRCCCVAATSAGRAASTSETSAATAPRTAARRATAPLCEPTASDS